MELTKLLGETGLTLTHDILFVQGRLRYLEDWDKAITTTMERRVPLGTTLPRVRRPDKTGRVREHEMRIIRTPASTYRRFNYSEAEKAEPVAYWRHVVETPNPAPLSLTFPKFTAWTQLRSVGWQAEATLPKNVERTSLTIFNPRDQATFLSELRITKGKLTAKELELRIALAKMIAEATESLSPLSHQGAVMRIAPTAPLRSIDLDVAQADPGLSRFVAIHERKASTQIKFVLTGVDPEGDDEDEDAVGIWK